MLGRGHLLQTCACTCVHAHMIHAHRCMPQMPVCTHTHTHTYMHACTHAHTHTHTHSFTSKQMQTDENMDKQTHRIDRLEGNKIVLCGSHNVMCIRSPLPPSSRSRILSLSFSTLYLSLYFSVCLLFFLSFFFFYSCFPSLRQRSMVVLCHNS